MYIFRIYSQSCIYNVSMDWWKTAVTPFLMHWSVASDTNLIKWVDPNRVCVDWQKNQDRYASMGCYLELRSTCIFQAHNRYRDQIYFDHSRTIYRESFACLSYIFNVISQPCFHYRLLDRILWSHQKPGGHSVAPQEAWPNLWYNNFLNNGLKMMEINLTRVDYLQVGF